MILYEMLDMSLSNYKVYCFIDKTFVYLEYKLWYNIVGYIYREKVNVGGYYEYNMVNLCTENRNPL